MEGAPQLGSRLTLDDSAIDEDTQKWEHCLW